MSTDSTIALCPPVLSKKGFSIEERIASGAFSEVFRAKWTQMPDKELALKRIDLSKVPTNWIEKNLKTEMKILKVLKHPNIIRVYELVKTLKFAYIFMDLAKRGNVLDAMDKNKKPRPLTEAKAKQWFLDVSSGLCYIHSRGIAHRDIKPDNFLIDEKDSAMLGDFGFACIDVTNSNEKLMKGTFCGTSQYIAIEMKTLAAGQAYDAKAADMYSMGISLYRMVNYVYPFNFDKEIECRNKQKNRDYVHIVKTLSKNIQTLIYALLDPNPNTRITSKAMLSHPWFSQSSPG